MDNLPLLLKYGLKYFYPTAKTETEIKKIEVRLASNKTKISNWYRNRSCQYKNRPEERITDRQFDVLTIVCMMIGQESFSNQMSPRLKFYQLTLNLFKILESPIFSKGIANELRMVWKNEQESYRELEQKGKEHIGDLLESTKELLVELDSIRHSAQCGHVSPAMTTFITVDPTLYAEIGPRRRKKGQPSGAK